MNLRLLVDQKYEMGLTPVIEKEIDKKRVCLKKTYLNTFYGKRNLMTMAVQNIKQKLSS